jgi:membrane-associated PAP2 superfamily phosphatase
VEEWARLVLGEEVWGVVSRERAERHERLAQWGWQLEAVGMERVGMSYSGLMEARKLLQSSGLCFPMFHDAFYDVSSSAI